MKIIIGEPLTNSNNTAYQTLDIIRKSARISTLADTTLTTHGKPVFVPDWGGKCNAVLCVAVRISRLGKSIPQRFAKRYYDALSLAVKFEMSGMKTELQKACEPWYMAENFDGSVSCGTFEELSDKEVGNIKILLKNGEKETALEIEDLGKSIDEIIATASEFLSIRQGDITLLPFAKTNFTAVPNTHIEGSINGNKLLEFNIK